MSLISSLVVVVITSWDRIYVSSCVACSMLLVMMPGHLDFPWSDWHCESIFVIARVSQMGW